MKNKSKNKKPRGLGWKFPRVRRLNILKNPGDRGRGTPGWKHYLKHVQKQAIILLRIEKKAKHAWKIMLILIFQLSSYWQFKNEASSHSFLDHIDLFSGWRSVEYVLLHSFLCHAHYNYNIFNSAGNKAMQWWAHGTSSSLLPE